MKPALLVLVIVATALASSFLTCLVMVAVLDRPSVVYVHAAAPVVGNAAVPTASAPDGAEAADSAQTSAPESAAPEAHEDGASASHRSQRDGYGRAPGDAAPEFAAKSAPAAPTPDSGVAVPPADAPVIAQNSPAQGSDGQTLAQAPAAGAAPSVAQVPDAGAQVSTLPPAADTVVAPPPVVQQVIVQQPAAQQPAVQQVFVPVPVAVSTTSINVGVVGNIGNAGNAGYLHPTPVVGVPATAAAPVTTTYSNPQANGVFRQPTAHPSVGTIHTSVPQPHD